MDFIKNFNGLELVFIIILAILLFGPEKIPEIAAKLGSWVRTLRNLSSQVMENLREETGLKEVTEEGAALSSTLKETAAEMNSSTRPLTRSAASSGKDRKTDQGSRIDLPDQETDPADKKEQLENRLRTLENELLAIREELAKGESKQKAGSDD